MVLLMDFAGLTLRRLDISPATLGNNDVSAELVRRRRVVEQCKQGRSAVLIHAEDMCRDRIDKMD